MVTLTLDPLPDLALLSPTHRYEIKLAKVRGGHVVDDELDYRDPGEVAAANVVLLLRVDRDTHETEEVARCDLGPDPAGCVQAMANALDLANRWVKEDQTAVRCPGYVASVSRCA